LTPLLSAVRAGNRAIVQMLLDHGAKTEDREDNHVAAVIFPYSTRISMSYTYSYGMELRQISLLETSQQLFSRVTDLISHVCCLKLKQT
jgi:ankyrin repeat protein